MSARRSINPVNSAFLVSTPLLAAGLGAYYTANYGFHWMDAALFIAMYLLTGFSITAGYHRHFSHRSYDCSRLVQFFFLLFGAAAAQNSILRWGRDHRIHHRDVDTGKDPYNIKKGFLWAHMGWVFFKKPDENDFSVAPDLARDPLVRWQERYYLPILIAVGFGLPALAGGLVGRPFGGFLWGGLIRVVVVQHLTFFINSLAHTFGKRPYSLRNTARDSWWLAYLTYGEGYHNFHHRFAADYRNGHRWFQFDPTKWLIQALNRFGLAWRLTKYREEHILKARIETDMELIRRRVALAPNQLARRIEARMAEARKRLVSAYESLQEAKESYAAMRGRVVSGAREFRLQAKGLKKQWKLRVKQNNLQFQAAQAQWAILIAAFGRFQP